MKNRKNILFREIMPCGVSRCPREGGRRGLGCHGPGVDAAERFRRVSRASLRSAARAAGFASATARGEFL